MPNKKYEWRKLIDIVQKTTANEKTGHDYEHIKRVVNSACNIAHSYKTVNHNVLTVSCLLHDISMEDPKEHHIKSAYKANVILGELRFPEDEINEVYLAILYHNPYADKKFLDKQPRKSIEAKILCDADRLDSLGAIGIIRMNLFSNRQGIPYFISEEDRINQSFYGNIKDLVQKADNMWTPRGRQLARERKKIIMQFLEQFGKELKIEV